MAYPAKAMHRRTSPAPSSSPPNWSATAHRPTRSRSSSWPTRPAPSSAAKSSTTPPSPTRLNRCRNRTPAPTLRATLDFVAEALQRNAERPAAASIGRRSTSSPICSASAPGLRGIRIQHPATTRNGELRAQGIRIAALAKQADACRRRCRHAARRQSGRDGARRPMSRSSPSVAKCRSPPRSTNSATSRASGCVVELLVDDEPVGEQTVDVPAGGEATVHFTHRFNSPGSHAVTLRARRRRAARSTIRACSSCRSRAAASAVRRWPRRGRPVHRRARSIPIRPATPRSSRSSSPKATWRNSSWRASTASSSATWPSSRPAKPSDSPRYAAAGGGIVFFLGDRVIADQYNAVAQSAATGRPPSPISSPSRNRRRPALNQQSLLARLDLGPITRHHHLRHRSARLPPSDRRPISRPRTGRPADDANRPLLQARNPAGAAPTSKSPPRFRAAIRSSSPRRSVAVAPSSSPPTARSRRSIRKPANRGPPGRPGPAFCPSSASCWPTPSGGQQRADATTRRHAA